MIGLGRALARGVSGVEFFSAGERADHRASFIQATLDLKPRLDSLAKPAVE